MAYTDIAKYTSIGAIGVALVHVFWPNLGIDSITLSLILIAIVPWLLPSLKSLELPGGIKIEFKDLKAALDKIKHKEATAIMSAGSELKATGTVTPSKPNTFETLRHVATYDPNLALVGFRIELEKRLLTIAKNKNIDIEKKSLGNIVRTLQEEDVFSAETVSGITDLILLGNRAAHGAKVEPDAVNWVLDVGPSVLDSLDGTNE